MPTYWCRRSLAPAELAREKEELRKILAEALEEVDQEKQPPPFQPDEHKEKEEPVVLHQQQVVEEVRRSSVSTVELDDTEAHIAPSGSFLGN